MNRDILHADVEVIRCPLPRPLRGATDGRRIFLDDSLTAREERCVLEHERIHLERGHTSHQIPAVEREIDREVARRLISTTQLEEAMTWAITHTEAAKELNVTDEILETRIQLHQDELNQALEAYLGADHCQRRPGVDFVLRYVDLRDYFAQGLEAP